MRFPHGVIAFVALAAAVPAAATLREQMAVIATTAFGLGLGAP